MNVQSKAMLSKLIKKRYPRFLINTKSNSLGSRLYFLLLLGLLSLALPPGLFAQQEVMLRDINQSYRYQADAEVNVKLKAAVSDNRMRVFLQLTLPADSSLSNYIVEYFFRSSYRDDSNISYQNFGLGNDYIEVEPGTYLNSQNFLISQNENVLVVSVANINTGKRYDFDLSREKAKDLSRSDLLLFKDNGKDPIFDRFVTERDSFQIQSVFGSGRDIIVNRYEMDFLPADPPMGLLEKKVQREMRIDSTFTMKSGKNYLLKSGYLYFAQKDTSQAEGLAFRVEPNNYPRYTKVEQLIAPLIYISTNSEQNMLQSESNKKMALDKFWMDITRNEERAKNAIRKFYRNVERANGYFSSFKEGWKTDQGMIMMIFGSPGEVYRDNNTEEWIYTSRIDDSTMSFTFVKVNNLFSDNYYQLVRSEKYDRAWFRALDLWRKGRI